MSARHLNQTPTASLTVTFSPETATRHRFVEIEGFRVFYREAGNPDRPTLLLLHGFPTSSHMFRNLIPLLADQYHVVAPDMPGFGQTQRTSEEPFAYTFASLTEVMEAFVSRLGLDKFALYMQDYGAPVGLRLALNKPEHITAIVSQNGNAYMEGVNVAAFQPILNYWNDPTAKNRATLRALLTPETTQWQYSVGVADASLVSPDNWVSDLAHLTSTGNDDIQLDLFFDYRTNVALYADFQAFFRQSQVPLLAAWGKNDPFFIPPGAEAFKRDLPAAEVHLLDAGHFALESHLFEIASLMRAFLGNRLQ